MAIEGIIQPEFIQIDDQLRLRKYDGHHDFAFDWYEGDVTVGTAILKDDTTYKWLTDEKFIDTITSSCKEEEFINKLIEVLKPLGLKSFKKQFKISKYRIDLYLPELNIAIEYDENNHKGYTYEQQEGRQKEIEENLGCKFIRVTDNKTDEHNIGYVINKMFDELIKFRNKKYSTCTLGEILKQEEIKEKLIDDAINTAKDILKSKI